MKKKKSIIDGWKKTQPEKKQQIENELTLCKLRMLDEGLRRLGEAAQPVAELSNGRIHICLDKFLHTMTIKVKVETDGIKWWYNPQEDDRIHYCPSGPRPTQAV